MFVLQVYILKHTHFVECNGFYSVEYEKELQPIKVPLYVVILMALCTAIPYVWIASSLVFWIVWFKKCLDPESSWGSHTYWRLRDSFLTKSI